MSADPAHLLEARRREALRRLSPQGRRALANARRHFAPPQRLTVGQWAERYRVLHSGPLAGSRFNLDETPALRGILEAYSEPTVSEIWCQKSAQVGWTQGVVMNVMGYHVHLDPCPILVLFAKDGAGKRFMREKMEPCIRATRPLAERIPLESRSAANTQDYKRFPGGFLQLAGTNSAPNLKSTDARVILVEEPDDTARDVRGQGDSIALGRERKKSYPNGKMVVGGTPTVKSLSKIEAGMKKTDQRRFFVACPHCEHEQTLRWENVMWQQDAPVSHPVYGTHRPDTAGYACEECGVLWTESERHDAIRKAAHQPDHGWRATAAFTGIAGFIVNELVSLFAESRLPVLVQKFLEATAALKHGDDTLMRSFVNNTLGESWEIRSDAPETEEMEARAEAYAEWSVHAEALVATAFVDVQRGGESSGEARLEYLVVGWGRGAESWRIARGQIIGNPLEDGTWDALDAALATPIKNLGGGTVPISMVGVDSGDGMTQEAVYRYCRRAQRQGRNIIPTKGNGQRGRAIFTPPKAQDHTHDDRAARWGLKLYLIGTEAAKDAIAARLKLEGRGPGRMHWYEQIGIDYYEQVTAEVRMPGRNGHETWVKKAGRANEMLDCEVGNLHLAKRLRLEQWQEHHWVQLETRLRQRDLASMEPPRSPTSPIPVSAEHAARRPPPRPTEPREYSL